MCMETVVTKYQLVPPYYSTPQTEPGTPNNSERECVMITQIHIYNNRKKKVMKLLSAATKVNSVYKLKYIIPNQTKQPGSISVKTPV